MAPKSRRTYGTGSVTYEKARDRWVASIEAGWTRDGTRRRRKRVAKTERGARRLLLEMMREADQQQAPRLGGKPTVKSWAETWLEATSASLRPTTWRANRSQVAAWIIPTIGHRRLDQLSPADIRAVHRAMDAAGLAPSTISRAHAVLAGMLKSAIMEGHAVPQAPLLVEAGGKGEPDRDVIPLPDALPILAASTQRRDASRWAAALLQGIRPAEARGLLWDEIDFEAATITISWQLKPLPYRIAYDRDSGFRIPRGYVARPVSGALHLVRPKTSSGWRVLPLVPWMRDSLLAWREVAPANPYGLVWPDGAGRPRTHEYEAAEWISIQDAAQVARVDGTIGRRYDLYECRHTTATLLREAGVDDETIRAIVGHSSILSTRAYLHTDSRRTRAALEQVADRLRLTIEP